MIASLRRVRARLTWCEAGRSLLNVAVPVAASALVATLLRRVGTVDLRLLVVALAAALALVELYRAMKRRPGLRSAARAVDRAVDRVGDDAHDALASALDFADSNDAAAALTRERALSCAGRLTPAQIVPIRPSGRSGRQLTSVGGLAGIALLLIVFAPLYRTPAQIRHAALQRYLGAVDSARAAHEVEDRRLARTLRGAAAADESLAALAVAAREVQTAVAGLASAQAAIRTVHEAEAELSAAAGPNGGHGEGTGHSGHGNLDPAAATELAGALDQLEGRVPEALRQRAQDTLKGAGEVGFEPAAELPAVLAELIEACRADDPVAVASLLLREQVARKGLSVEDLSPAVGAGAGGARHGSASVRDPGSAAGRRPGAGTTLESDELAAALAALAPRLPPPGSGPLVDRYFEALELSQR